MNHAKIRLEEAQRALGLNNRRLAAELRVSEFWLSKVLNGRKPASGDLMLRLDDLLRRRGKLEPGSSHLKSGGKRSEAVDEPPASYETVASRIPQQRSPSTREDCENLFQRILDAAELSNDPNAFPAIYVHLQDGLAKKWPPTPPDPS